MSKTLSIVIPAYNEEKFIGALLDKLVVLPVESLGYTKELIVVDDGSKDRTSEVAGRYADVRLVRQQNQGKGAAVQHGIKSATGTYILIQDADLEYDPNDILVMLKKLNEHPEASIYGSRILGERCSGRGGLSRFGKNPEQSFGPWLANVILSVCGLLLYGQWITDLLTGYKIYPRELFLQTKILTKGFETDHEITAKLKRRGIPIYEVPVSYRPRSVAEGKKIRVSDGFKAVLTLLRFRFARP